MVGPAWQDVSVDALQRKQIEQRRQAVAALLAQNPTLGQREIARKVGSSQKTISRDVTALRLAATHAAAQARSAQPTEGQRYRQRMDDELARVSGVIAAELFWSVAEVETLQAVATALDRRAAMLTAYADCD